MAGWERSNIDEICNVEYGTRVVRKRNGGSIYPVYGGGGATFFMDEPNREDRMVVARFGMSEQCTRFVEGKFFLNDSGLTLSPKNPRSLLQKFLDLQIVALNDRIFDLGKGAAQKNLDVEAFRALPLVYPRDLKEQQRIVTILDEAFAGIASAKASAEKNLQNARELFDSYLYGLNVNVVELGELVDIKTGKLDANAAVDGGQYPFFTCSREIFAIDKFAFDCDAILLAGNNAVGDFNVKHYKGKFNAYQRTYVITVNASKRVLSRFLYFQMLRGLKKFKEQSVGAGTKFLKLGMIKNLKISLPDIHEQARIVSTMDSLLDETGRLETLYQAKLDALDELRQSLLTKAFAGDL